MLTSTVYLKLVQHVRNQSLLELRIFGKPVQGKLYWSRHISINASHCADLAFCFPVLQCLNKGRHKLIVIIMSSLVFHQRLWNLESGREAVGRNGEG